ALRQRPRRRLAAGDPAESQGAGGLPEDMSAVAAESSMSAVAADAARPLIAVEGIHTYYGKSHILDGVSLHVGPGEVVGLLGRNGVGKSTTLKTIMGLVRPARGKVLLNGNLITGLPPYKLARLGIG